MSQIETVKLNVYPLLGPDNDEIAVPKVCVYILLTPGSSEDSPSQAHVYAQKIRRG